METQQMMQKRRLPAFNLAFLGISLLAGMLSSTAFSDDEQDIIRLPLSDLSPTVDGKKDPREYEDAVVLGAFRGWTYSPRPQSPALYLKRDRERLYVLYDNPLKPGEYPTLRGAMPDNSQICMGNAIELFFVPKLPAGEMLHYIQFIGNARGCIYDAKTIPQVGVTYVAEFNLPWQFRNTVLPEHWYAEVSVRFQELGIRSTVNGEYLDADFGRDGGTGANGVHSYAIAYHQVQSGKGVRIVFDDSAPAVQWLSFGNFEQNLFDPKLRLKSTGRPGSYRAIFLLTESTPSAEGVFPMIFREAVEIALPAGQSQEVSVSKELPRTSKGIAHYRIMDASDRTIFYRRLPFTTNLEAPKLYPEAKPEPLVAEAKLVPSYGRVVASADFINFPGNKDQVVVEVTVRRADSDAVLGRARIDDFRLDFGQTVIEIGEIKEGDYVVGFRALERGTWRPTGLERTVTLRRKVFEWEDNRLGLSDKVPHPWTPLKFEDGAARCWGRSYRFSGLGLPASIETLQPEPGLGPEIADVLAGEVALVAEAHGRTFRWQSAPFHLAEATDTQIRLAGSSTADSLRAEAVGTLEYDGFYRVELTVHPKEPTDLNSLRIEVPMASKAARLFFTVGESMRTNKTFASFEGRKNSLLWDSKTAARNALVKGNFLPVAWMGNEDRGISWMCDSDRGWQLDFDKPCLDVVRDGKVTSFRIHLVNKPVKLTQPLVVVFGLQATPFRPRPEGGSWKTVDWYGWGYFDKPLLYHGCFDGIKKPGDPAPEAWYRTEDAKQKNRWWRYFCFNSDRISEADATYGDIIKTFGAEWYAESVWTKYQNKSHQDFELWAYKQWHDTASMDGIYYDNAFPAPSTNLANGVAWVDDEGRLRPGYGVMAYREFMKRVRSYLLEKGPPPVIKTHVTDTPISGYLGFADFWLDGENGGYPDPKLRNPDFVDRWYNPMGWANLRITLGRQWGVMPQYLYSWGVEPTHAVLGQFDLQNEYKPMGRKPFHDFGLTEPDVRFIPHWDARGLVRVTAGGPDVLVATWQRPRRARLLISNLSKEDRLVSVKVDLKGLGLPKETVAVGEREGGEAAFADGVIRRVEVKRHDYQVVLLGAPGEFTPLDRDLGKALEPPQQNRISLLCNDFASVGSAWQQLYSPHINPFDGVVFSSCNGYLRIRTSTFKHALLKRPFGQDNCSVQLKIREPNGWCNAANDPGLALFWGETRWARIRAGLNHPSRRFIADGHNGSKEFASPYTGPTCGLLNWVKMTLKPGTIEFHASSDGQSWELVHTQPREGLEGAPDWLLIGHGSPGKNLFLRNDGYLEGYFHDSFFDDLIVSR